MKIDTLIDQFIEAAVEKGDFAAPAIDHRLFDQMKSCFRQLYKTQPGREAFRRLLDHRSLHVRAWVAAQLLAKGEERAGAVMEALAAGNGIAALNARTVLQEYQRGTLRSPFDTV